MITAQKMVNGKFNRTNKWQASRPTVSRLVLALALVGCDGRFLAPSALAEGFRNPPAGAFNLGRAGGRIAQIDDSSAVAQNPANLVDLQSPEVNFAPSFVYYQ